MGWMDKASSGAGVFKSFAMNNRLGASLKARLNPKNWYGEEGKMKAAFRASEQYKSKKDITRNSIKTNQPKFVDKLASNLSDSSPEKQAQLKYLIANSGMTKDRFADFMIEAFESSENVGTTTMISNGNISEALMGDNAGGVEGFLDKLQEICLNTPGMHDVANKFTMQAFDEAEKPSCIALLQEKLYVSKSLATTLHQKVGTQEDIAKIPVAELTQKCGCKPEQAELIIKQAKSTGLRSLATKFSRQLPWNKDFDNTLHVDTPIHTQAKNQITTLNTLKDTLSLQAKSKKGEEIDGDHHLKITQINRVTSELKRAIKDDDTAAMDKITSANSSGEGKELSEEKLFSAITKTPKATQNTDQAQTAVPANASAPDTSSQMVTFPGPGGKMMTMTAGVAEMYFQNEREIRESETQNAAIQAGYMMKTGSVTLSPQASSAYEVTNESSTGEVNTNNALTNADSKDKIQYRSTLLQNQMAFNREKSKRQPMVKSRGPKAKTIGQKL